MMFIGFMESEMKDGCANSAKVKDFKGKEE